MTSINLDARLSAVASMIRDGVTLYDIGSDHAYLPVSLLLDGKIPFAYICDVARGPLSKAEETVKAYGVGEKCRLCLSDGMKSVDVVPPCDISIAGMGGELIASIIDACPDVRDPEIRLVLQPMTRGEELRRYLSENGFEILHENTVFEGKYYTVISCRYTGNKYELSPSELLLGRSGVRNENAAFYAMAKNKLEVLSAIYDGKKRGGADCSYEEELIKEIIEIINGEKR
ncbi:MAG: SAM-dependent methyltransferase [Ruminococcaceae bacterium]|nr:SAM-dependent methyltransferase [Oscillospiraceae bacterium]